MPCGFELFEHLFGGQMRLHLRLPMRFDVFGDIGSLMKLALKDWNRIAALHQTPYGFRLGSAT